MYQRPLFFRQLLSWCVRSTGRVAEVTRKGGALGQWEGIVSHQEIRLAENAVDVHRGNFAGSVVDQEKLIHV
jgi:hypothetical protein